jgi:pyruvate carboxylase
LFLTSNNLTTQDVLDRGDTLSFPESVVSLFKGELGQPYKGFPKDIAKIILKGKKPFTDRPNAHLEPINFQKEYAAFHKEFDEYCDELDFLSYKLYPKVFTDFYRQWQEYGEVWRLPTRAFLFGLKNNEEIFVEIGKGKAIIIKKLYTSSPDENGMCNVYFEMNGQARVIQVKDKAAKSIKSLNAKIEGPNDIGAPLQGRIAEIMVKVGDKVKDNQPLFSIEAMKMETTISASKVGKVTRIHLKAGQMVSQDDLVLEVE